MQTLLFLTAGFPGVGKSTLAHTLAKELGLVHLIADQIRGEMTGGKPIHSKKETLEMLTILDEKLEETLQDGKSVICDVNFLRQSERKKYYDIAEKHNATCITLWFDCPLELALARNQTRSPGTDAYYNNTPDEAVTGMYKMREEPAEWENVIVIDAEKELEEKARGTIEQIK